MSKLSTVKLGDIAELVTSGSRGWAAYYSDTGSKFIRMTNLPRSGVSLKMDDLKFVNLPGGSSEGQRTRLKDGDILISITAELGKIGYVPNNLGEAYINQHLALVRIDSQKANPKFIANLLSTPRYRHQFNRNNDAGAKAGLNLNSIKEFQVNIPDLETQTIISTILTTWESYIAAIDRKIQLKCEIKNTIQRKLLSTDYYDQEEIQWMTFPLSQLGALLTNKIPKFEGEKPYYSTSALTDSRKIELVTFSERPSRAAMYPNVGDVGLAKMKGTSRCFVVGPSHSGSIFSTGFSFLRLNKNCDNRFIYHLFKSEKFQYYKDLYSSSGIMGGINNQELLNLEVSLPIDISMQQKIAQVLDTADLEICELKKLRLLISDQKDFLLGGLANGIIRTPENLTMPAKEVQYA